MRSSLLWGLAFVLMLAAGAWQRRTGPSYPLKGTLPVAGSPAYALPRSHETTTGTVVSVPAVRPAGALIWRRSPTNEPYQAIPLSRHGDSLTATLPPQPPAGKVEYYLELEGGSGPLRVPAREAAVLRYHGPVPLGVLIPHIATMFLSMLIAVRAGLGALLRRPRPRVAWEALVGFTIGGLILGPIVQKYAFGAYWTGVPWGWDLTDNKTLLMWLAWLVACLVPVWWARTRRPLVLAAAALTIVVYVIPHSTHGSQLDYQQQPAASATAAGS